MQLQSGPPLRWLYSYQQNPNTGTSASTRSGSDNAATFGPVRQTRGAGLEAAAEHNARCAEDGTQRLAETMIEQQQRVKTNCERVKIGTRIG